MVYILFYRIFYILVTKQLAINGIIFNQFTTEMLYSKKANIRNVKALNLFVQ